MTYSEKVVPMAHNFVENLPLENKSFIGDSTAIFTIDGKYFEIKVMAKVPKYTPDFDIKIFELKNEYNRLRKNCLSYFNGNEEEREEAKKVFEKCREIKEEIFRLEQEKEIYFKRKS